MKSLTIVTGSSSNHFRCLKNLLYSTFLFEPRTRVIVYDLGLELSETEELKSGPYELRTFRFDDYPEYFRIDNSQRYAGFHINKGRHSGCYAWKPVIVSDLLHEFGGMVLWLDAGDLVTKPLDKVRSILEEQGIYSPTSSGNIARWTHLKSLQYLRASPNLLPKRNRNGAVIGLDASRDGIMQLVQSWKDCALEENCIAPAEANHANHRWDQAIFSVLAYQFQEKYQYELADEVVDILIQKDELSEQDVRQILGVQA